MENIEKIEIKPNQFVWVDKDAEIKEGDTFIRVDTNLIFKTLNGSNPHIVKNYCKKIIASSPELKLEGVPSYVGWLAEQEYTKHPNNDFLYGDSVELQLAYKAGVIDGYKTAEKELFTEEDIRKALSEAFKAVQEGYDITTEEIIEQLKQSKTQTK